MYGLLLLQIFKKKGGVGGKEMKTLQECGLIHVTIVVFSVYVIPVQ